ncbi:MAG: 4Fe-4S dicluster domain-containing protein [Acidobacteria bacterium]|nr:4Fe-4S dicluster domain-containing protein [Planctomycetota bacterium]MBE3135198.1 4Fe-4S dicluster domain-containing protein [Acidobacteriota bacterium]
MADEEQVLALSDLDLAFCEEVASQPGGEHLRRCFACGTCAAGCPVTEVDPAYNPRKIIRQILFGMRKEVLSSPEIWYCLVCYRCYARCPQKVNFTDVMRALRYLAIKGRYAPGDTMKRLAEIDRASQALRHDLVEYSFTKRREVLDGFRHKVAEQLGSLNT